MGRSQTHSGSGEEDPRRSIKSVLENLTRELVDEPEECSVTLVAGGTTCVYELRCSPKDAGKIVGKQGKMAEALRTLVRALSARKGIRAVLEICN